MLKRTFFILLMMASIIAGYDGTSNAITINYQAYDYITGLPTNQTATADFTFTSGKLQIILTETTGASTSSLTGAGAILTSIGFLLPGSVTIVPLSSSVVINSGSQSVGFSSDANPSIPGKQPYPAGTDVSGEWGATVGKLPINTSMGDWDFVSTITAQVTQFSGASLDNPESLDGPQGGLLNDSANRGGLGVIDNSVIITLALSGTLTQAWVDSLTNENTIIEYGSDAAFSRDHHVPEPGTLLLLGFGLVGLRLFGRRKLKSGS